MCREARETPMPPRSTRRGSCHASQICVDAIAYTQRLVPLFKVLILPLVVRCLLSDIHGEAGPPPGTAPRKRHPLSPPPAPPAAARPPPPPPPPPPTFFFPPLFLWAARSNTGGAPPPRAG